MRDRTPSTDHQPTDHQRKRVSGGRLMYGFAVTLAVASASVGVGATTMRSNPIEDHIAFASDTLCLPSDRMQTLLDALVPLDDDGQPIAEPTQALPHPFAPYASTLQRQRDAATTTGSITLNTRWHGLRLTSLSHWVAPESDHQGFRLRFANAPEVVRAALNRMGIAMPASGEIRRGRDVVTTMTLSADGQGAILACSA